MQDAVHGAPTVPICGNSGRLMLLTPNRLFYSGLLGAPCNRMMGGLTVYVAVSGSISVRVADGPWVRTELAVLPPYVRHSVTSESGMIDMLQIEAETIDERELPAFLRETGACSEASSFVAHVRALYRGGLGAPPTRALPSRDFDECFFGSRLPSRTLDPRIASAIDRIKRDPSAPADAAVHAAAARLSYSRFLHLFKQETGVPFRTFCRWKRARNILHFVTRSLNLAHLALDVGYPDSTHFSHSIRQIYGLRPRDIFAGSRRLAVYAQPAAY